MLLCCCCCCLGLLCLWKAKSEQQSEEKLTTIMDETMQDDEEDEPEIQEASKAGASHYPRGSSTDFAFSNHFGAHGDTTNLNSVKDAHRHASSAGKPQVVKLYSGSKCHIVVPSKDDDNVLKVVSSSADVGGASPGSNNRGSICFEAPADYTGQTLLEYRTVDGYGMESVEQMLVQIEMPPLGWVQPSDMQVLYPVECDQSQATVMQELIAMKCPELLVQGQLQSLSDKFGTHRGTANLTSFKDVHGHMASSEKPQMVKLYSGSKCHIVVPSNDDDDVLKVVSSSAGAGIASPGWNNRGSICFEAPADYTGQTLLEYRTVDGYGMESVEQMLVQIEMPPLGWVQPSDMQVLHTVECDQSPEELVPWLTAMKRSELLVQGQLQSLLVRAEALEGLDQGDRTMVPMYAASTAVLTLSGEDRKVFPVKSAVASHGSCSLSGNELSFTPEPGFTGSATVALEAVVDGKTILKTLLLDVQAAPADMQPGTVQQIAVPNLSKISDVTLDGGNGEAQYNLMMVNSGTSGTGEITAESFEQYLLSTPKERRLARQLREVDAKDKVSVSKAFAKICGDGNTTCDAERFRTWWRSSGAAQHWAEDRHEFYQQCPDLPQIQQQSAAQALMQARQSLSESEDTRASMNLKTQLALEQYEADMMWTVSRLSSETTPTEEGQQVAMPEGTAVELELISDSTHDECRVLKATAKHGKCETAGSSLIFRPNADFIGVTTIEYTTIDGYGHEELRHLDIEVQKQLDGISKGIFKSGDKPMKVTVRVTTTGSGEPADHRTGGTKLDKYREEIKVREARAGLSVQVSTMACEEDVEIRKENIRKANMSVQVSTMACEEDVEIRKENIRKANMSVQVQVVGQAGFEKILENGDREVTHFDGTVELYKTDGTLITNYPDGTVEHLAPDGHLVTTQVDGTLCERGSDGTTVFTFLTGLVIVAHPDGTKVQTDPDGRKIVTKPDGTTLQIDPDNTEIVTNPNGSAFVAFWGDVDSEEGLLRTPKMTPK